MPMKGPLPGERYMPSNSSDGMVYLDGWCVRCDRDKELNGTLDADECDDDDFCPIVAASFRDEAEEWRELPTGELVCLAFVPKGEPEITRCEHTRDMFWFDCTRTAPTAGAGGGGMTLPQAIRRLIAKHGTLRAVSRETGLDVGYLSRLEHGEKDAPSDETLAKLGLERRVTYHVLKAAGALDAIPAGLAVARVGEAG